VALQLDRKTYRLRLPYRPLLAPGQNQRFQLALIAPKASRHPLRVIMDTSDGRRGAAARLELLYFVPKALHTALRWFSAGHADAVSRAPKAR